MDDHVIKAMAERPSVSMGCRVEHPICSVCGVFDTKCTHAPSDENRAKDGIQFSMISAVKGQEPNKNGDSFSVEMLRAAFDKLK